MNRITPKLNNFFLLPSQTYPDNFIKICPYVFELSCSQTNSQTNPGKNITSLAELIKTLCNSCNPKLFQETTPVNQKICHDFCYVFVVIKKLTSILFINIASVFFCYKAVFLQTLHLWGYRPYAYKLISKPNKCLLGFVMVVFLHTNKPSASITSKALPICVFLYFRGDASKCSTVVQS